MPHAKFTPNDQRISYFDPVRDPLSEDYVDFDKGEEDKEYGFFDCLFNNIESIAVATASVVVAVTIASPAAIIVGAALAAHAIVKTVEHFNDGTPYHYITDDSGLLQGAGLALSCGLLGAGFFTAAAIVGLSTAVATTPVLEHTAKNISAALVGRHGIITSLFPWGIAAVILYAFAKRLNHRYDDAQSDDVLSTEKTSADSDDVNSATRRSLFVFRQRG